MSHREKGHVMSVIRPPHNKQAKEVTKLTADLKEEITMMIKMLLQQDFQGMRGLAIAHPQVSFDPYRIFVKIDSSRPEKVKVVINPIILAKGGYFNPREACLSFPRPYKATVPVGLRYRRLKVRYFNEKLEEVEEDVSGIEAQVFQHEIEHFDGKNIYGEY